MEKDIPLSEERAPSHSPVVAEFKVKNIGFVLAAFFIWTTYAESQINSGTVVVVGISKDKIIMAAESRGFGGKDALGNKIYHDGICKLAALNGKILYGATGLIADYSEVLPPELHVDAMVAARKAFGEAPKRMSMLKTDDLVQSVADGWHTNVSWSFIDASAFEIDRWLSEFGLKTKQIGITGIFGGISPNGEIRVLVRSFGCKKPNWLPATNTAYEKIIHCNPIFDGTSIPSTPDLKWYAFGVTDITSKNIDPVSRQVRWTNLKDWQIAVRLVDLTIAFSKDKDFVNKPIDAVELQRDGIVTWFQNEQGCKED